MAGEAQTVAELSQAVANLTQALARSQAENAQLRATLERVIGNQPPALCARTAAPRGRG